MVLPESKVETVSSGAFWPQPAMAFGVEALVSEVGPLEAQEDLPVEEGAGSPQGDGGHSSLAP